MIKSLLSFYRDSQLLGTEVMGINRRNLELIIPHNPRANLVKVNEKVDCKLILEAGNIPAPGTIAICRGFNDLPKLRLSIEEHGEFVIKPSRGLGGEGILLIVGKDADHFIDSEDNRLSTRDAILHAQLIMDGVFSLDNYADRVLVEELIKPDANLGRLCGVGVPDIRVIVFHNQIVSAMLRLPTRESGGRANLHQGGVGVGIDISSGLTTAATAKGELISRHPDTQEILAGHRIPHWERMMEISPRIPALFDLAYVGIDFIIDRIRGPLVLEVNGRPGLQIQVANQSGLRTRFRELEIEP